MQQDESAETLAKTPCMPHTGAQGGDEERKWEAYLDLLGAIACLWYVLGANDSLGHGLWDVRQLRCQTGLAA